MSGSAARWHRSSSKTASGRSRKRELGAVPDVELGRLELGIGDVEPAQAPQGIAHESGAGGALHRHREMLELTAAAFIGRVMSAAGLDAVRARLDDRRRPRAGEPA